MGTNTLTDRIDGQVVDQTFFNEIHQALNGTFPPRNASGVPTDVGGDLGSTTYRFNNSYIATMYFGAIASGLSFSDDSGDIVIKRNSVEVGRFTANGLDGSDLVAASVTLAKMAANSVDTSQLVNDSVTNAKIDAGAVGTTELASGAVTSDKLGALAVITAAINTGAVTTAKIAAEAVTLAKLADVQVTTAAVSASTISPSNTTQIASLTFEPLVTDRPVVMRLNGTNVTSSGFGLSSSGTACSINVIFKVGGTQVLNQRFGANNTPIYSPFSIFDHYDYSVTASSQTYSVEVATDSVTTWTPTGGQFQVFQI